MTSKHRKPSTTFINIGGLLLLLGAVPVLACSATASASTKALLQEGAAKTVWVCRPGLAHDPCDGNMSTTVVTSSGSRSVTTDQVSQHQKFNCFYLYPTASIESRENSNLTVQPVERSIAMDQAARFSKVCNVWAPMYRQVTVNGLGKANSTDPGAYAVAYHSVLADWNDFIKNDDHGRPIIFLSHSQGSVMLIKLLQAKIDPNPKLRKLVVEAIIVGGNVTVPTGKRVGATFRHLPLCNSIKESGCVIAYSSFPSEPPTNSNFARPGQGISLNTNQTATKGVQVACVNPAALGGGTRVLDTYWPVPTPLPIPPMTPPAPAISTPWLYYPDQYTGTCESQGGATWLQVSPVAPATDQRPFANEIAGPTWGYHFQDINLALGNLIKDVHDAEAAYSS